VVLSDAMEARLDDTEAALRDAMTVEASS
jgi:hypothetical protein